MTSWRYTETLEGAFDIVADGPSDVPPQGNWPASQDARSLENGDYWYHSFDIVADGPSDVLSQGNWPASQNAL